MASIRFIVLSTQRSGSTWLIDTLDQHPDISCHGELLLQGGQGRPPFGAKSMLFWEDWREQDHQRYEGMSDQDRLLSYLDKVYSFENGQIAIGFKLMYGQLGAYPEVTEYMLDKKLHVIHLVRQNYLNVLVSLELAYARDIYHVCDEDQLDPIKIQLDTRRLLNRLQKQEKEVLEMRMRFSSGPLPYFEVTHEELHKKGGGVGNILGFLSVQKTEVTPKSRLRKINRAPLSQVIENYHSVVEALKGTRFENLLQQSKQ